LGAGAKDGGRAVRQLGLFTVLCIGVNNIVGSGIYKKPSELARHLGGASWLAFALDALLLATVALCFAAMSARHDEAGGPYLYARKAFGKVAGLVVAWTAWISMWAALAATATGLPDYLHVFFPGANSPAASTAIALALVLLLGWLNCRGVKAAAGTATFLTVAKLVPLLVFVVVGFGAIDWARIAWWPVATGPAAPPATAGTPAVQGLLGSFGPMGFALFAAFYPLQGFEVVPVPAGELKNARRDVPLAVTLALLLSGAFYCLIQIVAVGTCPDLAGVASDSTRPLATAAQGFLGAGGEKLMAAGACISMFGFAAVTIFCAPRYLVALGSDGVLPAWLARHHPTRATPVAAVVVTTIAALFGVVFSKWGAIVELVRPGSAAPKSMDAFEALTALSNLAVLVQYAVTCVAVIQLRAHVPGPDGGFKLLGGRYVIPLLGLCASAFLFFLITQEANWDVQYKVFGAWVAGGLLLSLVARGRPAAGSA
jgi:amino acid transporter